MNPEQGYLCRCECVSGEAVQAAIDEGNLTINDIKRRTRAGMGICQGIFCADHIARRLVDQGVDPATIAPMTARPPTRLIPLTVAASAASEG
jgi:NAD(P)H-nitrite reductase large subunit